MCASRQTNLVFFEDAVKHIIRISRVLRLSRGSALLIGIGGSGKQSLTRLAAAIANYPTSQIEAGSSYGPADFREDLKEVLHVAGVEGKHVVLLLSDSQVGVGATCSACACFCWIRDVCSDVSHVPGRVWLCRFPTTSSWRTSTAC